MSDLFSDAADQRLPAVAPLALRMRPQSLEEFVGQQHVLGPGSALRLAIEEDRVRSAIFYGPPGTGKTTLARIVARATGAEFEELSAVSATVAQVRGVLAGARERLGATGRRTILFLDEIHRFNKAQQDALLPGVEEGVITLIGATTENPYMEVNSALLSRAQVYELESLSIEDLETVARRGAAELGVEIPDDLLRLIATRAGGDARSVHNIVELAVQTAQAAGEPLAEAHVDDAARKRPLVYDKGGDAHHDFISAWIKSTRAGDVQASVYYLAAMLEGGEDARFIARRMIVLASEDIGNADPQALLVAVAAAQAVEHVGLPEARLNLAQAAVYLARAPKSNASYRALGKAMEDVRERGHLRPPDAVRSAAYPGARKLGRGLGYLYPHEDPRGFEVDCLPEELAGTVYYEPSGNGAEVEVERSATARPERPPRTDQG
jgi:putative ATPase